MSATIDHSSRTEVQGRPPRLKDKAYNHLKHQILRGIFPPGHFMTERRIASELGMSKTPVREALERLLGEQFVSVAPQQGYVVNSCSVRELAEHFEFRLTLEPFFLRQSARNLTEAQAQIVRNSIERQHKALIEQNAELAISLDSEFHLMFARFASNREMFRCMNRLCERMFRVVSTSFEMEESRFARTYEEHRRIAEAVLARDGDLAAQRLCEHLENCRSSILKRTIHDDMME